MNQREREGRGDGDDDGDDGDGDEDGVENVIATCFGTWSGYD